MPLAARIRRALASPAAALLALTLGAYAYFYQAGGWNQNSRFDLTRAIVEKGTSRIDAYHRNTGDKAKRGEHYYCDKAPGVSWIAVPPAAVTRGAGVNASAYVATVWTVGIPSAVAVVLMWLLLGALGFTPAVRAGVAAAWGLATLAFPYATLFYGHQLVAALLLAGFALIVNYGRPGPAEPGREDAPAARRQRPAASTWRLVVSGFLLGAAVAVEYPAALGAAVIGVYALVTIRPIPRVAWMIAGAALPAAAVALYHAICFGGPLALPYAFSTQKHRHMGFFMGLGRPNPRALASILVSSYRGIFFSMPWLVLALPGAVFLWRRARAEVLVCAAIIVLFVWLNASLVDWEGGWAMGARYLIPALPFLAILAAGVLAPPKSVPRAGRIAITALFAAGAAFAFVLMLVGAAVKPEVPVYIRHPFGEYLLPAFRHGRLALSTQSIDGLGAPANGPRFAWNLGQWMGLRGLAQLLPLGVWIAGCGAWLTLTLRPRRGL